MSAAHCECPEPQESVDDRKAGSCIKCGKLIDAAVLSSDPNIRGFYDRLESTFPGKAPVGFAEFRRQAEAREREGRSLFGLRYLRRPNLREAKEEGSDGGNYFYMDMLQNRHLTGRDDDMDLVLEGAWHAFKMHEVAQQLSARRRGSP